MRATFFGLILTPILTLLMTAATMAGVGSWTEFEGGRARLLAGGDPSARTGQAWLEIELEAGWKTYWLEPGDGGVPPSVTLRKGGETIKPELAMPAPSRFREPNTIWAGYKDRTYISMTYPQAETLLSTPLHASAFLGICREICIPVEIDLTAPLEDGEKLSAATDELYRSAKLPEPFASEGLLPLIEKQDETFTVTFEGTALRGAKDAELFVASAPKGLRLATPLAVSDNGDGVLQFEIPILREKAAIESGEVSLLLSLGGDSYHGTALLPQSK
ncbi:protein-disulfide reductase DsbD domain-containing protein [Notoacmeibacter sp. MSK16QG-6]|uniref:protein-disulfide reductase DsbD domain-containing protein n=1 Tax=Notoacmeibacter sp. MSK16QG-6 TaxID=2957982 RepID=UPI00209CF2C3|nr:protein-disulfide reductase DsbD domain-containing protein [Notoacmeibacter sp. MSK16QG-6]MCP1198215.1 hypothetical protein [Notoacmeibacter sp. MSK16QG-6]